MKIDKETIIGFGLAIATILILQAIYMAGYSAGMDNISNTEAWQIGYNTCMNNGGK